jgi:hypothetical protein
LVVSVIGFAAWYIDANTPSYYKPGSLGLEVTTDKPTYGIGENVTFIIKVNNPEDWPVRYPNSESATVKGNGIVTQLLGSAVIDYPIKAPTYPAREVTIINKTWNQTSIGTSSISSGNYTFTYSIQGYGYDISANCTFTIEPIEHHPNTFGISLRPDKPYFLQGENITFTGTIMTENESLPYPLTRTTTVENLDATKRSTIPNYCIEHFTYSKNIPAYPANTNTTVTWTWNETKISQHTPGQFMLRYEVSGEHWSISVRCIFEIKEK